MKIILEGSATELGELLKAAISDEVKASELVRIFTESNMLGIEHTKEVEYERFEGVGFATLYLAHIIAVYGHVSHIGKTLNLEKLLSIGKKLGENLTQEKIRSRIGGEKKVSTRLEIATMFDIHKSKIDGRRYSIRSSVLSYMYDYLEENSLEYKDWLADNSFTYPRGS